MQRLRKIAVVSTAIVFGIVGWSADKSILTAGIAAVLGALVAGFVCNQTEI